MKIRINVTARDIERARAKGGGSFHCPINLAARRHNALAGCTTGATRISITRARERPYFGEYISYDLPDRARAFIHAFDFGDPVEPFSFVLEVV